MPATATLERPTGLTLDQSVTLDELVTMVSYAERLAFFFARCNAPVLRDRLIDQATQRLAGRGVQVVAVSPPPNTANVRPYLRQQLDRARGNGAGDGRRVALFVTDLEHSLPFDRPDAPVLTELNMGRELFHRDAPVPIVFWLPDYALTIVARSAPDFWAWRSGVFDFALDPLYRRQAFQQYALRDSDWLSVDNMTTAQKQQRLCILEGLLEEYDQPSDDPDVKQERIELLFRLAQINQALDDLPRSISYYRQYLEIVRRFNDRWAEGAALGSLGNAYADMGAARQAIEYYQQALAISREIGDRWGEGSDLGNLGVAYAALGDVRRAIGIYEQALVISREIGDRRGEGNKLGNLGLAYAALGDARRAIDYYEQALVISREIGDRRGEGNHVGNLGRVYADLGDWRNAIDHCERSLTVKRETGDVRGEGEALCHLGYAYDSAGDASRAVEYYTRGLDLLQKIGYRLGEAQTYEDLGQAFSHLGDMEQARQAWQHAIVLYNGMGSRRAEAVQQRLAQLPA
jgi:tetratricopeptide (TPR) repeat protein